MHHLERMTWLVICVLLLTLYFKEKKNTAIHQTSITQTDTSTLTCQSCATCPPCASCAPCDCAPSKKIEKTTVGKAVKKLPPPPELNAQERQQLLAWVKKNLHTLYPCRDAGQPIYRMTVALELDQKGEQIKNTSINGDKIPGNSKNCIQSKIKQWKLPKAFGENAPKLVFGLALE